MLNREWPFKTERLPPSVPKSRPLAAGLPYQEAGVRASILEIARSGKSIELGRSGKIWSANGPNHQPSFQLDVSGALNRAVVPPIRKPQDRGIPWHNVQLHAIDLLPAKRRIFTAVFRKPQRPKTFCGSRVLSIGRLFRDHHQETGRASSHQRQLWKQPAQPPGDRPSQREVRVLHGDWQGAR